MTAKNIAVVLSGCGYLDGSEVHEVVLTLLALTKLGCQYQCFSPDVVQRDVINHMTGELLAGAQRSVLIESARIVRDNVRPLNVFETDSVHALIVPGGFGAAKNLCNFAQGGEMLVDPNLGRAMRALIDAQKPVGFLSIAAAMLPYFYPKDVLFTVGKESENSERIARMGGKHVICEANSCVADDQYRVVSTPALLASNALGDVEQGINALCQTIVSWIS